MAGPSMSKSEKDAAVTELRAEIKAKQAEEETHKKNRSENEKKARECRVAMEVLKQKLIDLLTMFLVATAIALSASAVQADSTRIVVSHSDAGAKSPRVTLRDRVRGFMHAIPSPSAPVPMVMPGVPALTAGLPAAPTPAPVAPGKTIKVEVIKP